MSSAKTKHIYDNYRYTNDVSKLKLDTLIFLIIFHLTIKIDLLENFLLN